MSQEEGFRSYEQKVFVGVKRIETTRKSKYIKTFNENFVKIFYLIFTDLFLFIRRINNSFSPCFLRSDRGFNNFFTHF